MLDPVRPLQNSSSTMHNVDVESAGGYVEPTFVPVLIVGGGPTGLLLAYMLSKLNREPHLWIAVSRPSC